MRLAHVLIVLVLAAPAAAQAPPGILETCDGNDDAGSGHDATSGNGAEMRVGTNDGCVGFMDSEEWLYFVPKPGKEVSFKVDWDGCRTIDLRLHRVDHHGVWHDNGAFVATGGCEEWTFTDDSLRPTASFWLHIRMSGSIRGTPYQVHVRQGDSLASTCAPEDDAGSGRDASWARPIAVHLETPIPGCTDEVDQVDAYVIDIPAPGLVHVKAEVDGECDYFDVIVARRSAEWYTWVGSWDCNTLLQTFTAPAADTYDLYVAPLKWAQPFHVEYVLTVDATDPVGVCGPTQDDAGSGRDASPGSPVVVASGTRFEACSDEVDTHDVFALQVTRSKVYEVRVEPVNGCATPWFAMSGGTTQPNPLMKYECGGPFTFRAPRTGHWYLHAVSDDWQPDALGAYALAIRTCEEPVSTSPLLLPAEEVCDIDDLEPPRLSSALTAPARRPGEPTFASPLDVGLKP